MTMERQHISTNSLLDLLLSMIFQLPSLITEPIPMLNNIVVQEEEVFDQIKILDCNKSYGPDGISPRFIKIAGASLVKSLTILFNILLSNGIFPSNWKKSKCIAFA